MPPDAGARPHGPLSYPPAQSIARRESNVLQWMKDGHPATKESDLTVEQSALVAKIRDIPDFPVRGIMFRDITTLLKDAEAFHECLDKMANRLRPYQPTKIVGVESRGFIFGAPLAYLLGAGFVPARKLGKLPAPTVTAEYALEYGTNTVEMHRDAIDVGERVVIVDDLLATGGTTRATIQLVEHLGGQVVALGFLIELTFLHAREQLGKYNVVTLIQY
jgi:adenine phosphoribosyltransferase